MLQEHSFINQKKAALNEENGFSFITIISIKASEEREERGL